MVMRKITRGSMEHPFLLIYISEIFCLSRNNHTRSFPLHTLSEATVKHGIRPGYNRASSRFYARHVSVYAPLCLAIQHLRPPYCS